MCDGIVGHMFKDNVPFDFQILLSERTIELLEVSMLIVVLLAIIMVGIIESYLQVG